MQERGRLTASEIESRNWILLFSGGMAVAGMFMFGINRDLQRHEDVNDAMRTCEQAMMTHGVYQLEVAEYSNNCKILTQWPLEDSPEFRSRRIQAAHEIVLGNDPLLQINSSAR